LAVGCSRTAHEKLQIGGRGEQTDATEPASYTALTMLWRSCSNEADQLMDTHDASTAENNMPWLTAADGIKDVCTNARTSI
jgi:hypothetical protein